MLSLHDHDKKIDASQKLRLAHLTHCKLTYIIIIHKDRDILIQQSSTHINSNRAVNSW